ncbi:MAG: hypothetical protein WDN72_08975 [Alphaproteobacteria bacterium]
MELLHALLQTRLEQGGIAVMTTHAILQGGSAKELNLSALTANLDEHEAEGRPAC